MSKIILLFIILDTVYFTVSSANIFSEHAMHYTCPKHILSRDKVYIKRICLCTLFKQAKCVVSVL